MKEQLAVERLWPAGLFQVGKASRIERTASSWRCSVSWGVPQACDRGWGVVIIWMYHQLLEPEKKGQLSSYRRRRLVPWMKDPREGKKGRTSLREIVGQNTRSRTRWDSRERKEKKRTRRQRGVGSWSFNFYGERKRAGIIQWTEERGAQCKVEQRSRTARQKKEKRKQINEVSPMREPRRKQVEVSAKELSS